MAVCRFLSAEFPEPAVRLQQKGNAYARCTEPRSIELLLVQACQTFSRIADVILMPCCICLIQHDKMILVPMQDTRQIAVSDGALLNFHTHRVKSQVFRGHGECTERHAGSRFLAESGNEPCGVRLSVVPTYRGQAGRSALHRIFLSDKWKSWHISYLISSALLNLLKLVLSVSVQVEDAIHNCLYV